LSKNYYLSSRGLRTFFICLLAALYFLFDAFIIYFTTVNLNSYSLTVDKMYINTMYGIPVTYIEGAIGAIIVSVGLAYALRKSSRRSP